MFFSLDVLRAHKGDCLMLHYGTPDDPHLMLIDGGPSDVYKPQLKPRLQRVHAARKLDDKEPLPIDVVMVSHIDDDHIKGILDLTKEQRSNVADLRLDVTSLWYNGFDDLLATKPEELAQQPVTASVLAGTDPSSAFKDVDIQDENTHQAVEVLSSVPQGRTLRDDAQALGWTPNHKFKKKLILASDASKPVSMDGLTITVVGPMHRQLQDLQAEHDKWLKANKDKIKSPEAMLAAFVDASVPNLSSIVVLVEAGGKTMLLTGDARGDKILEGMELVDLLASGGTTRVDILKVPHHGSQNNMETVFFRRVIADHYVFSGDGEHGNPERETLEMLLEARGEDDDYTIHLTYPVEQIDEARKADWTKEQTKEKKRGKGARDDWSPANNSLTALFKAHPKFKAKIKVVADQMPHLIDLLDPVKI